MRKRYRLAIFPYCFYPAGEIGYLKAVWLAQRMPAEKADRESVGWKYAASFTEMVGKIS